MPRVKFMPLNQRNRVMMILRRQGFSRELSGRPPKITDENGFIHVRLRHPKEFTKIRTVDTGRAGFTKLRVGRMRGEKVAKIQSILLSKRDYGFGGK